VLETREEEVCIEHWVENTYKPAYQLFAVSKRNNHRCIAMLIGTELSLKLKPQMTCFFIDEM